MNIITEPTVRLVGRLTIDETELANFLEDEGVSGWQTDTDVAAEKLVETAGRLCYKSYAKPRPGGNAAYLSHILGVGHGSVVEHAVYNFIITGVSRSFTHELVRHRAGFAYSQRSQRFCDEGDLSVVVPPSLNSEVAAAQAYLLKWKDKNAVAALTKLYWNSAEAIIKGNEEQYGPSREILVGLWWLRLIDQSQETYKFLSDYLVNCGINEETTPSRKQAREAARSVLPNATETQIFVTANARALRHFIEARGDASADAEIRAVAFKILTILQAESPNLFGDYEIKGGSITTPHRKV